MTEQYWYLKNCDLFQRLTADELREVESSCRVRKFTRNSPIYLPADQADGVLLLVSGRAKICSFAPDGKQSILTFIEPGEMFGELVLLEPGAREEYAEAVVDSTVVFIPADEMKRLAERHASVALGVTRMMGLRRRRIERRLKYLLFHSNRERLVHLLLELAEQYGRPAPHGLDLAIRLSHQDLASIIGSTRETVTVILGQLESDELVRLGRRKILLRNVERLAQSVNGQFPRSAARPAGAPKASVAGLIHR
jgi:CRP-like cAMP-binding protein